MKIIPITPTVYNYLNVLNNTKIFKLLFDESDRVFNEKLEKESCNSMDVNDYRKFLEVYLIIMKQITPTESVALEDWEN